VGAVRLEAALLRAAMPDLVLREGAVLAARVAERSGKHGLLMLAGSALVAELPDEVRAGERLRLAVQDAAGERVVLRIVPEPPTTVPPALVPLPLPDGRTAHVRVDERAAEGARGETGEATSVALVYDSPALGAVELRLSLEGGRVGARVQVGTGAPLFLAEEGREALRAALAEATRRPAEVAVVPRHDPLDVYA
jgi:hypothetical protein